MYPHFPIFCYLLWQRNLLSAALNHQNHFVKFLVTLCLWCLSWSIISWEQLEAGQVKLQSRLEEEEQAKAALLGRIQRLTKLILVSTKNSISSSIPGRANHRRRHSFGEDEVWNDICHLWLGLHRKHFTNFTCYNLEQLQIFINLQLACVFL